MRSGEFRVGRFETRSDLRCGFVKTSVSSKRLQRRFGEMDVLVLVSIRVVGKMLEAPVCNAPATRARSGEIRAATAFRRVSTVPQRLSKRCSKRAETLNSELPFPISRRRSERGVRSRPSYRYSPKQTSLSDWW